MTMPIVECVDASFRYEGVAKDSVHNASLRISPGETVCLMGANGAGKTTLMKMMIGLLKPTGGNVKVGGLDVAINTVAQLSRVVGYVFQNPDDQIFHSTVEAEIAFAPKNLGLEEAEINRRVKAAAALLRLSEYLQENPANLPYSVRKMVCIASVIAMQPRVILLDEPTAGQDAAALKLIGDLLRHLSAEGVATVTVSHDMEFCAANYERGVLMADSQILFDGPMGQLFSQREAVVQARIDPPVIPWLAAETGLDSSPVDIPSLMTAIRAALDSGTRR